MHRNVRARSVRLTRAQLLLLQLLLLLMMMVTGTASNVNKCK